MVVGNKYLVGDGGGYDIVTCVGSPTKQEFEDRFGYSFHGVAMKVIIHDPINGDFEDIFYEADGHSFLYIEPR